MGAYSPCTAGRNPEYHAPVRRKLQVVFAAFAAALLPHASARPGPASAEREAPAATLPPVELHAPPSVPRPRVLEVSPRGERVPLDAPLTVRFDAPVPLAERASLLALTPRTEGELRFLDDQSLVLSPKRWRPGKAQRVRVNLGDDSIEWSFRTRVPMPSVITPGEGARLVLTFDDGPNDRRQADRLLDRLKDLEVRALFFPSGRWTATRKDWVERARSEGHRVCNHTKNHVNLTAPWMTVERITEEIRDGASDGECKLFRPPLMGFDTRVERIASALGYELFLWDIDSRDWEGGPSEDVAATVLGAARPDAVVLFHIHADSTFQILPLVVEQLRKAGYVLSWDLRDAPNAHVGPGARVGARAGARAEWGALADRPSDTESESAEAGGLGPP